MLPSDLPIKSLDDYTKVIYLDVPKSQIVLLQVFFELYEGLGTIRTLNKEKSVVIVLTTPGNLETCLQVLDGLKQHIQWRMLEREEDPLH